MSLFSISVSVVPVLLGAAAGLGGYMGDKKAARNIRKYLSEKEHWADADAINIYSVKEFDYRLKRFAKYSKVEYMEHYPLQHPQIESRTAHSLRYARGLIRVLGSYKYQEEIIGDLDERYLQVRAEHSAWFSKFWYWEQAIRTMAVIYAARLMKWGFLFALGEKIKRFIS